MDLLSVAIPKLKREYYKWRYLRAARKISGTKPLSQGGLPFILLSMVQKRDVVPYLVAVKSFAQQANPLRIVVICDPSIDANDRQTFQQHVPHIELRDASEYTDPRTPKGGTWERLVAIATYVKESYVVQLDSDTVTVKPIPEVVDAAIAGTAFVLGGEPTAKIGTLVATSQMTRGDTGRHTHIQDLVEQKMAGLDRPDGEKYVRGCSGFTGFPQSQTMLQKCFDYSTEMRELVGDRWSEWGTEQVTSNYLAANAKGTEVLPFLRYGTPDCSTPEMVFFHFIGYTRYVDTKYETTSRQAIHAYQVAAG